jgi:hypothetical protein
VERLPEITNLDLSLHTKEFSIGLDKKKLDKRKFTKSKKSQLNICGILIEFQFKVEYLFLSKIRIKHL